MKTTKLLKPELSLGLQDQETVRRLLATLSVRGEAFKEDRGGGKEDLLEAAWSLCGETHLGYCSSAEEVARRCRQRAESA